MACPNFCKKVCRFCGAVLFGGVLTLQAHILNYHGYGNSIVRTDIDMVDYRHSEPETFSSEISYEVRRVAGGTVGISVRATDSIFTDDFPSLHLSNK
jgi:hypothetical protein